MFASVTSKSYRADHPLQSSANLQRRQLFPSEAVTSVEYLVVKDQLFHADAGYLLRGRLYAASAPLELNITSLVDGQQQVEK